MIKPLYGFVTDTFPILGRRRRPYLILCGLSGVQYDIILFATATPSHVGGSTAGALSYRLIVCMHWHLFYA